MAAPQYRLPTWSWFLPDKPPREKEVVYTARAAAWHHRVAVVAVICGVTVDAVCGAVTAQVVGMVSDLLAADPHAVDGVPAFGSAFADAFMEVVSKIFPYLVAIAVLMVCAFLGSASAGVLEA